MERRKMTPEEEAAGYARMEAATLELRRRHFRETTPGERIEEAFELNELANEIREGVIRAQAGE